MTFFNGVTYMVNIGSGISNVVEVFIPNTQLNQIVESSIDTLNDFNRFAVEFFPSSRLDF